MCSCPVDHFCRLSVTDVCLSRRLVHLAPSRVRCMNPTRFRLHVLLYNPLPSNKESRVHFVLVEAPCQTPKHLNSGVASSYIGSVNPPANPSLTSDVHMSLAHLFEQRLSVSTTNILGDSGCLTSTRREVVSYLKNQIRLSSSESYTGCFGWETYELGPKMETFLRS